MKDLDQKIPSFPNCDNYGIAELLILILLMMIQEQMIMSYISSYVEHLRLIICRKWIILQK